jgi:hypothetical protein
METGTGYYGHVAITAGTVRGRASLEPALEIELRYKLTASPRGLRP